MSVTSGGGKPPQLDHGPPQLQHHLPGQVSGPPAWAGPGALGGNSSQNNRTFAQIIAEEQRNRNIIEIQLSRTIPQEENQTNASRGLTFDDLGELIFDIIKIDPNDCVSFDYNTGRYDTKHIQLKPTIQADLFVTTTPIIFKGYEVSVRKQLNNITRVTFRNVPLNVPNEEILHLCKCYGNPVDNKVYYETLTNSRNKGMRGSTRFVDMELKEGYSMMNYYWLEGPLSGDQGRRVLVLHNGQSTQCSHCLKKAGPGGCTAGGNGKACNLMNTPRAKMYQYMEGLKNQVGYVSLKTKYVEQQARNFPSLPGFDTDIRNNMDEYLEDEGLVPINPIEEKDKLIAALEKRVESLKTKENDVNQLREDLCKSVAEIKILKTENKTSLRKLNFTKNVTEQRILESISDPDGQFHADPVLIGLYSATLDEEEFNFEETSENDVLDQANRSRRDAFLKTIEDKVDLKNSEQKERFMVIKNQVLEKVKATQSSRARSRSGSRRSKRDRSSESQISGKSSVRMRTSGIPMKS